MAEPDASGSAAREVVLPGPMPPLQAGTAQDRAIERALTRPRPGWRTYLHALRPHHWLKNALVFVPLLVAHRLYDASLAWHALLAFATMCLCASSVYLLNDLRDLSEDQLHPHKKQRALASGQLPAGDAMAMIPLLLLGALLLGLTQPPLFLAVVGLYCAIMLAYCLRLRALAIWDTLALGAGYSLRVAAGSVAVGIAVSPWLLLGCLLFFAGLALWKRYAEIVTMRQLHGAEARVRAYAVARGNRIAALGRCCTYVALLVLAADLSTSPTQEPRDGLFWLAGALLFGWLTHMWRMVERGRVQTDPVSFALADPVSRVVGLLIAATLLLAA